MGTTQEDIRGWLERGKDKNATHLIVVCDTFDHGDYPVFVSADQDVREVEKRQNEAPMSRVMEVYRLDMDWDSQLNQIRAFNY